MDLATKQTDQIDNIIILVKRFMSQIETLYNNLWKTIRK